MNGDDIIRGILIAAASVVSSLVAVRTRFALIEARLDRDKAEVATQRQHDKEMLEQTLRELRTDLERHASRIQSANRTNARRGRAILELLAEVANKQGITHRAFGSDALVRSIADDNPEGD